MRIKTKVEIFIFFSLRDKLVVSSKRVAGSVFRERESAFSLDFPPFGPSVRFGPRSKVVPHGDGYVWTLIWWNFDNSTDLFLLVLFFRKEPCKWLGML